MIFKILLSVLQYVTLSLSILICFQFYTMNLFGLQGLLWEMPDTNPGPEASAEKSQQSGERNILPRYLFNTLLVKLFSSVVMGAFLSSSWAIRF